MRIHTNAMAVDEALARELVKSGKVKVVGLLFEEQNYGIALQVSSPYREKINIALLKLIESGAYQEIVDRWFGS